MKKNHQTKLIQGIFTVEKAKYILLELINQKIKFHSLKKFSNEERFGEDCDNSLNRINELVKEREELLNWLNKLTNAEKLKIESNIHLEQI